MEGFVKLHRIMMAWEWFDDSKVFHVFVTILLNANHQDGLWRGHEVKKGQWITGRKKLSKITKISEQTIRTILGKLESTGELTIKSTNKFSLITVVNWDTYQIKEKKSTSKSPTDQPAINQRSTTNKNEKECKEVINLLNEKSGKNFKAETDATKKLINGRIAAGYCFDDFKIVIENKVDEWMGTEHEKYLRPSTLFSPAKFESYLNQKSVDKKQKMNWE